jgi:DNA-binding NtrC family response regulator
MSDTFLAFMHAYDWPGNVRELENLIERSVIMSEDSSLTLQEVDGINVADSQGVFSESLVNKLLTIEDYIRAVIERYQTAHSDKEIAEMLGIGRKALWERRRKWGISRDRTKT